ncbi:hypothetical protein KRP22_001828 [Phytophthora ramorum]|nr:hypothetical protein KRP22_1110 [Phytophthora ramorum]
MAPLLFSLLLLLFVHSVNGARSPPQLPRQFQAEVQVLSHLTDPRQEYPPSMGRMRVQYDFDQQLARAEMVEGYNAGKTFVRRYDEKQEFMVKSGEFRKCERAYLGDTMPTPEIPFVQEFVAMESAAPIHLLALQICRLSIYTVRAAFAHGLPVLLANIILTLLK